MGANVELRRGSAADLAALEPLWVSVHHQHAESMPELAPYVDDSQTWAARSALYAELLARPDTILMLAYAEDSAVGYGLAHVMAAGAGRSARRAGPQHRAGRSTQKRPLSPRIS
jgi:hypothetical protein